MGSLPNATYNWIAYRSSSKAGYGLFFWSQLRWWFSSPDNIRSTNALVSCFTSQSGPIRLPPLVAIDPRSRICRNPASRASSNIKPEFLKSSRSGPSLTPKHDLIPDSYPGSCYSNEKLSKVGSLPGDFRSKMENAANNKPERRKKEKDYFRNWFKVRPASPPVRVN